MMDAPKLKGSGPRGPAPEGLEPEAPAPDLRWLKRLVTVLTGTMIAGLVAVIWLLVIRLPAAMEQTLVLPATITLPEGARPAAVTAGKGWYAVVTEAQEILVFDAATGALRQRVQIAP